MSKQDRMAWTHLVFWSDQRDVFKFEKKFIFFTTRVVKRKSCRLSQAVNPLSSHCLPLRHFSLFFYLLPPETVISFPLSFPLCFLRRFFSPKKLPIRASSFSCRVSCNFFATPPPFFSSLSRARAALSLPWVWKMINIYINTSALALGELNVED